MPITPVASTQAILGEPEVVEDARALTTGVEHSPAWLRLKAAAIAVQALQITDGSVPEASDHPAAREHVATIIDAIEELRPMFPHDDAYLAASVADFARWADSGFGVPDFLDSLTAFQPQRDRVDGIRHLVVFPMYTQNGSSDRRVEAVLVEVIWPEFIAQLEAGDYSNKLFVSLRFLDFTPGYDTNSAVLFPETVAMREIPTFTWGAIFQDREAARYRRVVRAASEITKLELPADAARMLDDQALTEKTFVMWDMIHDRTHMRGDLPFDPFMIKQRMPFFLYSLEELRCDLTAFRECVAIEQRLALRHGQGPVGSAQTPVAERGATAGEPEFAAGEPGFAAAERGATAGEPEFAAGEPGFAVGEPEFTTGEPGFAVGEPVEPLSPAEAEMLEHAKLVQYAVIFDRIFRFAITGTRVRNYDGLGGQLLFAWLHQRDVLHWTDTSLAFDWDEVPAAVVALGDAIDELYWRSIDRPKTAHWLAAYDLVRSVLTPNPASHWARGLPDETLAGAPKGYTDAVMDDEFPLSMFYEALEKKMRDVIASTAGITGADA